MLKNISYGDSILFAKVLIICEISEENFEAVNAENADEADFCIWPEVSVLMGWMPEIVVKELLTTAENQRYIRFKTQARYKLRYLAAKTEGKGRGMGMQ